MPAVVITGSFGLDQEHQALNTHDAAALPRAITARGARCAPTRPCRATRRGRRARRDVVERQGDFADERVDVRATADRAAAIASAGCGRAAATRSKAPRNSSSCIQNGPPGQGAEHADHNRGDAEEDDVEAAGRREFDRGKHETQKEPMPPEDARIIVSLVLLCLACYPPPTTQSPTPNQIACRVFGERWRGQALGALL